MSTAKRGRPKDELHRRISMMLIALAKHPKTGQSRLELMNLMGLTLGHQGDDRKFFRDLKMVRRGGWLIIPLGNGSDSRYRLEVVDHRLKHNFTEEERAELLVTAQKAGLGQLYADLGAPADGEANRDTPTALGSLQHAIRHRCLSYFTYHGKERVAHPYDLQHKHGRWYLRAREDGFLLVKTYRVDKMTEVGADLPGTADKTIPDLPPPNHDPMLRADHDPLHVTVCTSKTHLADVESQLGVHGATAREVPGAPGGEEYEVDLVITSTVAFLARLIELGERVRLLGPPEIRKALRHQLMTAAGANP